MMKTSVFVGAWVVLVVKLLTERHVVSYIKIIVLALNRMARNLVTVAVSWRNAQDGFRDIQCVVIVR